MYSIPIAATCPNCGPTSMILRTEHDQTPQPGPQTDRNWRMWYGHDGDEVFCVCGWTGKVVTIDGDGRQEVRDGR